MPSFFGKSHLYRYDIQGGAKSHYLVYVHLPSLHVHLKHLYSNLSLFPLDEQEPSTIECLMTYQSLTRDCIEYLFQRLQIRDRSLIDSFGLSYFNKTNQQSYWLDPNLSMKQQLPKNELKPNLTFTFLLYPSIPYSIPDEKSRLILYEQLFCNFISSIYSLSRSLAETLSAYFLRGCFTNEFHPEKNRDVLRLIISTIGLGDESKEKIIQLYRDIQSVDVRSAQNQFVHQISQLNSYGTIQLDVKNTLNEAICLGLNHRGISTRSLLQNDFRLETNWHQISSICSNKQRQITITIKHSNKNFRTLIYYNDSTNYNRYCLRLFQLFFDHYRKIPSISSSSCLTSGVSVPDLRSDGESSSSNDQTPPSSTCSSNHSANIWTGSLPNLTIQLSSTKNKTDPYGTFADQLNRIDEHEPTEFSSRRSLPMSSPVFTPFLSRSGVLGLSCSLANIRKNSLSSSLTNIPKVSPCFSCECLDDLDGKESPSNLSTITSTSNRSLLNCRTYLSSTSVPLESESVSVHHDASTDIWLADFESKLNKNLIYDEFDSIPLTRANSSVTNGRSAENIRRNRYSDVLPYDDTRVHLIPTKENLHGYINASHIKIRIENIIYSYIAAESPLPLTVHDFWRMISGSNVYVIVMLLNDDFQFCSNYFPRTKTEKFRTDEFQIDLINEQKRKDFQIRHLKMKQINGQRTRTLVHLQYTSWDNSQLPVDTTSFIEFLNVANSFRRHYGETSPCLVHCTAGIGRTGIFILLHVMIQCINFNKKVSVSSVLKVMREHRMSLIDRTSFYVFVYRCLIDYLKSSRLI